jgi:division protein CdvB (Snf7/Vps24/ESCRT-III family)
MKAEEHQWFNQEVQKFDAMVNYAKVFSKGLETLRNRVIEYDNKIAGQERQIKEAEAKLENIQKQIQEAQVMRSASHDQRAEFLQKKHLDLVERESKMALRERMIAEQQKKVDELLAAAEARV